MDQLTRYQTLIKQALQEYAGFMQVPPEHPYRVALLFDDEHREYLLRNIGWTKKKRIWHTALHVSIYNGKIRIEEDWTEDGIATYFLEHGVPNQDIVLGFQPPEMRQYTEFAAA